MVCREIYEQRGCSRSFHQKLKGSGESVELEFPRFAAVMGQTALLPGLLSVDGGTTSLRKTDGLCPAEQPWPRTTFLYPITFRDSISLSYLLPFPCLANISSQLWIRCFFNSDRCLCVSHLAGNPWRQRPCFSCSSSTYPGAWHSAWHVAHVHKDLLNDEFFGQGAKRNLFLGLTHFYYHTTYYNIFIILLSLPSLQLWDVFWKILFNLSHPPFALEIIEY